MWWAVYLGLCVFMALVCEDQRLRKCFLYSFVALLTMQVPSFAPIGTWQWLFSGAVWCSVSVATWRHSVTFSVLTLVSAMCYLWGRVGGYDFSSWCYPLFVADLAWLAAVFLTGGRHVTRHLLDIVGGGSMDRDLY